jgi:hypothetical protein
LAASYLDSAGARAASRRRKTKRSFMSIISQKALTIPNGLMIRIVGG